MTFHGEYAEYNVVSAIFDRLNLALFEPPGGTVVSTARVMPNITRLQ